MYARKVCESVLRASHYKGIRRDKVIIVRWLTAKLLGLRVFENVVFGVWKTFTFIGASLANLIVTISQTNMNIELLSEIRVKTAMRLRMKCAIKK